MLHKLMMPLYRVLRLATLPLLQQPGPHLPLFWSGPGKHRGRQLTTKAGEIPLAVQETAARLREPEVPEWMLNVRGNIADQQPTLETDAVRPTGILQEAVSGWQEQMEMPAVNDARLQHLQTTIPQTPPSNEPELYLPLDEPLCSGVGNMVTLPLIGPTHPTQLPGIMSQQLAGALLQVSNKSSQLLPERQTEDDRQKGPPLFAFSLPAKIAERHAVVAHNLQYLPLLSDNAPKTTQHMNQFTEMVLGERGVGREEHNEGWAEPALPEQALQPSPGQLTVHLHPQSPATADVRYQVEQVLLEIFDTTNNF